MREEERREKKGGDRKEESLERIVSMQGEDRGEEIGK